ncbi:putative T7SS-secreted protein [Nocardioides sp. NPDC057772]|uniref:putative T7SS-secreted protein n=1 Tax=Nocardioides sp. NPDC057772 TaxID=3346245 RepID=UPI003671CC16
MPDFTIKGNPGEIRSRGQTCADKGKFFDQTGDALTKIDTQGWIGRAADNFRDAHDREPNRWYEAGTGFRTAGNALIDYAAALEVAQQNAATAKSEYERGEAATEQDKANYADYTSRFEQARNQALSQGLTYPYAKEPFFDSGASIRSDALAMLETAKSDLKIAAAKCAREVRVGCKDAPEKRNWFESGLAFVGGIFEGAGEAIWDLGKMIYNVSILHDIIELASGDLTPEELAAQKSMMLEDAEALWQALKSDPLEFGKQLGKGLLDWDTWADDPARAIGHLVPDIVAGVLSGGTATAATRGIKGGADALDALGDMTKGLRSLDNLDGLGDVGKIDNGLDGLGDLGKLDNIDFSDAPTPPQGTWRDLNDPELGAWVDDMHAKYPELSRDEIKGIWDYTTDKGYDDMNGALRELPKLTPEVGARIDDAVAGLDRLPTHEGVTYRGTNLPDHVVEALERGENYSDPAFSSSSNNNAVAEGFVKPWKENPTLMTIDGHSGVDVRPFSAAQREGEFLFKPGVEFEVVTNKVVPEMEVNGQILKNVRILELKEIR